MIWSAHPTNALSDGRPLVQYDYLVLCLRLRALSKRGVHAVTVPVFEVARTLKCFIYFLRSHFFTRGSFASLLPHVGAYSHLPTSFFTVAGEVQLTHLCNTILMCLLVYNYVSIVNVFLFKFCSSNFLTPAHQAGMKNTKNKLYKFWSADRPGLGQPHVKRTVPAS